MGLRQIAEADLANILENSSGGFGWAITMTDPDELVTALTGFSNDVAQSIDPDTGQIVSGRVASVALRISSLLKLPKGIVDAQKKPWIIEFDDINGQAYKFKVMESNPDRALGIVTCLLEAYV